MTKTFLVDGSCHINKIQKKVYFRYKIMASSIAQAQYYCIEHIRKFFNTQEYVKPQFRELKGMDSTLNYLRMELSFNFVPYLKSSTIGIKAPLVECLADGNLKYPEDMKLLESNSKLLTEEECMERYGMTLQEYKDFPF